MDRVQQDLWHRRTDQDANDCEARPARREGLPRAGGDHVVRVSEGLSQQDLLQLDLNRGEQRGGRRLGWKVKEEGRGSGLV